MAEAQAAPAKVYTKDDYIRFYETEDHPEFKEHFKRMIFQKMQEESAALASQLPPSEQQWRDQQGVQIGPVLPSAPPPARPQEPERSEPMIPPPRTVVPQAQGEAPPENFVPPPSMPQPPGMMEAAWRGGLQGGTYNSADEMYGLFADPENLAALRARNAEAEKANPVTYGTAQAVGSILPTMAISRIPGGVGARALGMTGGTAARMAQGGIGGGLIGAGEGLASGDTWQERLRNARQQGIGGMVMGPIATAASRYIAEPIGSAFIAKFAPQNYEARQLRLAMERAGKTPQEIETEMQKAAAAGQTEFNITDALGEGARSVLNRITRQPSKAATEAKEALLARQEAHSMRVQDTLREGLDAKKTGAQVRSELESIRRAEANANYAPLRADPANASIWTPELASIFDTPSAQRAIKEAIEVAKERRQGVPRNPFRYDDTQEKWVLQTGATPDFHFLENFKVALDKGNRSKETDRVIDKHVNKTVEDLTAELDKNVSGYAAARKPYREASEAMEAIDEGKAAGLSGLSQDVIRTIQNLPPHKQAAFRSGYADGLAERMQKLGEGANAARFLTASKYKEELPVVAGDAQRAETMMEKFAREKEMTATKNRVTGGSQTMENLADYAAGLSGGLVGTAIENLATGMQSGTGALLGMTLGGARRGLRSLADTPASLKGNEKVAASLLGNDASVLNKALETGQPGAISVPLLQALGLEANQLGSGPAVDWLMAQKRKWTGEDRKDNRR